MRLIESNCGDGGNFWTGINAKARTKTWIPNRDFFVRLYCETMWRARAQFVKCGILKYNVRTRENCVQLRDIETISKWYNLLFRKNIMYNKNHVSLLLLLLYAYLYVNVMCLLRSYIWRWVLKHKKKILYDARRDAIKTERARTHIIKYILWKKWFIANILRVNKKKYFYRLTKTD